MASRKRILRFGLLVAVLVIVVLAVCFLRWSSRPVSNSASGPEVQGAVTVNKTKAFSTQYFSTIVPDSFTLRSQNNTAHADTLQQLLLTTSSSRISSPLDDQLAITIGKLPQEGLRGLSDIQFRTHRPNTYTPTDGQITSLPGRLAFIKTSDGYEMSVFWAHQGHYAAVVVSGTTDRAAQLQDMLSTVLSSWQWQN